MWTTKRRRGNASKLNENEQHLVMLVREKTRFIQRICNYSFTSSSVACFASLCSYICCEGQLRTATLKTKRTSIHVDEKHTTFALRQQDLV